MTQYVIFKLLTLSFQTSCSQKAQRKLSYFCFVVERSDGNLTWMWEQYAKTYCYDTVPTSSISYNMYFKKSRPIGSVGRHHLKVTVKVGGLSLLLFSWAIEYIIQCFICHCLWSELILHSAIKMFECHERC